MTINKNAFIDGEMILLRAIKRKDIELLRRWKNMNRHCFFNKKIISAEEQNMWFQAYRRRKDDIIFLILTKKEKKPLGCIGFRLLPDYVDLYNLIIDSKYRKHGYMTAALNLLIPEIKKNYGHLPISARVLAGNSALNWYLKRGFFIKERLPDYLLLELLA